MEQVRNQRSIDLKINGNGKYEIVDTCTKRDFVRNKPKDISNNINRYMPFDSARSQTFSGKNFVGWTIQTLTIRSGEVYDSYDGLRLVYEVGCDTIIFLNTQPKNQNKPRFYIQDHQSFLYDIYTRNLAQRVVKNTAPIKTVVKYEMYFILGLLSTTSFAALAIITGSDILYNSLVLKQKSIAARKLAQALLQEHQTIGTYAPLLHEKIEITFFDQANINWGNFGKKLPKAIATDEKTQGQLAGILLGKALLSPKAFNAWSAVIVTLNMAALRSVTKSPDVYFDVLQNKYKPLLIALENYEEGNKESDRQLSLAIYNTLTENGVKITKSEAILITREVTNHPDEVRLSIENINQALIEFNQKMNNE